MENDYQEILNDLINGNLTDYKNLLNNLNKKQLVEFIICAFDNLHINNICQLFDKLKLLKYLQD